MTSYAVKLGKMASNHLNNLTNRLFVGANLQNPYIVVVQANKIDDFIHFVKIRH